MKKAKKGFVMYFDNCKRLKGLPPKWRGEVVLVLSEYAERLDRGQGAEAYLQEQLARMPGEAALTLGFLADDARRDEAKYQSVIERRDQYKEERKNGQCHLSSLIRRMTSGSMCDAGYSFFS